MALLDEVGAHIDANSAFTIGTDLFLGKMPDTPDTCIVLYEYAPSPPTESFGENTGPSVENPSLQVVSRAPSYATARSNAKVVYDVLTLVANESISSVYYLRVAPVQTPFFRTRDTNQRVEFVFNCRVSKVFT